MKKYTLTDGVYFVGILNPNLRIFDIIMRTEYGTSYNSYVVKGQHKTALIDTAHATFFDEYLDYVKEITPIEEIDYIILNHTEPDHTGSLRKLLELNPNIKVVASMAGAKYAKAIANTEFDPMIVKDGDSIDLGGKTLKFINAPFLHWPDSMFTYVEEDKILFSCDMFGCHYCEPRLYDTHVTYPEKYEDAFLYYFEVIFSPFKEFVLKGIEKIKDLEIAMIAPSHGPIIVENVQDIIQKTRELATVPAKTKKKIVIVYVSAYGYTEKLAKKVHHVLTADDSFEVILMDAIQHEIAQIKGEIDTADGLFFGSPTINRDALKPIWDVLSSTDAIVNAGKPVGVFGSYGWSGEAVKMIVERLNGLKLKPIEDGVRVNFDPTQEDLIQIGEYTQKMIEILKG